MNDATRDLLAAGMKLPLAGFVLDLGGEALLDQQGRRVELRPQALAVLRHLALNAGRLVTKDELLAAVWPGLVVTDASLTQAICDVRSALGEAGHRAIKTVPRRGYTLVADAMAADAASAPASEGTSSSSLAPEADRPSIAVLAFNGPAGDADSELLARGVARDLVGELARNADLRVVSHHSSFAFAGTQTPLAEIGQRLRSRFLVDGTVRRDGETLRIDVELVESQTGRVVWSEQHGIGVAELPALRDALMRRIAGTVHGRARATECSSLSRAPKTLDVYALTVRGITLTTRFTVEAMREGRAVLTQATELDPDYAAAWAWLAYLDLFDIWFRFTGEWTASRVPECRALLQRAIALDRELPVAYRALMSVYKLTGEFDASLSAAQRGVELAPSSADCVSTLSVAQLSLGQIEAALHSDTTALELMPQPTPWVAQNHSAVMWANGQLDEAIRAADECLTKLPQYWIARIPRMYALVELGRLDEARRDAARLLTSLPSVTAALWQSLYAESAVALRERVRFACETAGIPPGP